MILDNAKGSYLLLPNSDIHFLIYYTFLDNIYQRRISSHFSPPASHLPIMRDFQSHFPSLISRLPFTISLARRIYLSTLFPSLISRLPFTISLARRIYLSTLFPSLISRLSLPISLARRIYLSTLFPPLISHLSLYITWIKMIRFLLPSSRIAPPQPLPASLIFHDIFLNVPL